MSIFLLYVKYTLHPAPKAPNPSVSLYIVQGFGNLSLFSRFRYTIIGPLKANHDSGRGLQHDR